VRYPRGGNPLDHRRGSRSAPPLHATVTPATTGRSVGAGTVSGTVAWLVAGAAARACAGHGGGGAGEPESPGRTDRPACGHGTDGDEHLAGASGSEADRRARLRRHSSQRRSAERDTSYYAQ